MIIVLNSYLVRGSHFYSTFKRTLTEKEFTHKKAAVLLPFVLITLLSLVSAGQAYDNWGASVAASGMGGAYIATAGDPANIFYNPAGLAMIKQYSLYGMYNRQSAYGYILGEKPYALVTAGALPFSQGVLALGFAQRGSWSKETQVVTHNTVTLSFARLVSPQVSLGGNAKFLFNTNYGDKSGADADLGLMIFATPQLTFGLVGENLAGTNVEPDVGGTFFLYNRRQVKVGVGYELINGDYRTRFGFDTIFKEKMGLVTDGTNLNNFGIQQRLPLSSNSAVMIRAGYSLGKDYNQDFNSYAFGISYELRRGSDLYRFDYSYQDYPFKSSESFAGDNRFALTVAFGTARNDIAKYKEELNLTSVNKPEKKQIEPDEKPVDESAELNKSSPLSKVQAKPNGGESMPQPNNETKIDANKSASQPPPPDTAELRKTTSENFAQLSPEENKAVASPVAGGTFTGLTITSQAKSNKDKSFLFLFQYNIEKPLGLVSKWNILISTSPSNSILTQGSDAAILHTIKGRGIPPTAVVWDANDRTGNRVAPGKYYYAMYLKSNQGDKFLTNWNPILIE